MLNGNGNTSAPASRLATRGKVPTWLVDSGLLKDAPPKPITLPDCLHGCQLLPFEDENGRVVVKCLNEPPCFEGHLELSPLDARFLTLDIPVLLDQLRCRNRLRIFNAERYAVEGTWFVGVREFRSFRVFVYLAADPITSLSFAIGDKLAAREDYRAVLLHGGAVEDAIQREAARSRVTLHPLPDQAQWDFDLDWTAIGDALDPRYLANRLTDNGFIYEDVQLRLSTEPGIRHHVWINGAECTGFSTSDALFSRLLLLASHRATDANVYFGGWVEQDALYLNDKGKRLDKLREAFTKGRDCGLGHGDLRGLIRANPETPGQLRLALDPANIELDASLRQVISVQKPSMRPASKKATPGSKTFQNNMRKAIAEAEVMFQEASRIIFSGGV